MLQDHSGICSIQYDDPLAALQCGEAMPGSFQSFDSVPAIIEELKREQNQKIEMMAGLCLRNRSISSLVIFSAGANSRLLSSVMLTVKSRFRK